MRDMSELHLSLDCEEEDEKSSSADMLYLSRRALKNIPASVLNMTHLKSLYLEGNEIRSLPERFFSSLSSLVWLDVRNNRLTGLPAAIGQHRCLKTLLLEGNPISALPPELGHVISLKALSLRKCPLTSPPRDVLDRGLPSILRYLRSSQLGEGERNLRARCRCVCVCVCVCVCHLWLCIKRMACLKNSSLPWFCSTGVRSVPLETLVKLSWILALLRKRSITPDAIISHSLD
ncbi:leucine-rich repeat-containing protein 27-like isoform X1 [Onychostoma macrolepis]|uniref:leucine-rich repeat-containing protein 27-like isoform X1 n=1 Tax=Onychostoma macrolepis TaxID=369639 RepID=UPI00272AD789|nr:leucine-rich repeat-containing protein 27-like isoform X1 [Onychostoma macrolepis]